MRMLQHRCKKAEDMPLCNNFKFNILAKPNIQTNTMENKIKFKDFNFKLAVLDQLMFRKKLMPAFDVREYIRKEGKKFDINKHGYKPVPGVKKFLRDLEIPAELLAQVDIIDQNYHTLYHQVIPHWDGEGDEFNITSTDDLKLVPNLKEAILLYDYEQKMVNEFIAKGIPARYL